MAPPGGDFPARRTIRTHIEALTAMGAEHVAGDGHRLEAPRGLKPASIYLDEASVTGTETALLAAAAAPGISEIRHAACEPHVVELCEFLALMGVGITGAGSHTIRVEGGTRLGSATKALHGDYIEAGSWAVVGAITGGEVEIRGARALDMEVVTATLRKLSVTCRQEGDVLIVEPSRLIGAGRLTTGLVAGLSERPRQPRHRARHAGRRGDARARLALRAAPVRARADERHGRRLVPVRPASHHRDRAGASSRASRSTAATSARAWRSLRAALAATGQSRVEPLETVERGYGKLVERLQSLGAQVAQV